MIKIKEVKNKYFNTKKAFSLIELSIVLLIISIIITGAMSVSVVAVNNAQYKVTNERMQEIYKSMGQFLVKNYRLPCPASLMIAKTSAGYGSETSTPGVCENTFYAGNSSGNLAYGMVPVNALGLSSEMAEDGFGSKIIYIVSNRYTVKEYPLTVNNSGFSYFDDTLISNKSRVMTVSQMPSGNNIEKVILIIMSSGANRYRSFNSSSTIQNTASSPNIYEEQNAIVGATAANGTSNNVRGSFGGADAQNPIMISSDSSSDVFDDILLFKRRSDLISDFNAMFLIPCLGFNSNGKSYSDAYYGELRYASSNCTNPSTARASYRCGENGLWSQVDVCIAY